MGRDVAAVGERVDPGLLGSEAEERSQVLDVRVDAAVGDESEQVHVPTALERRAEDRALVEGPVLDRLVHPHQVLVEDPARTDRQVAHLGVAHLARGQADGLAGRLQRGVRVLGPQPVEDGGLGEVDRVARAGRRAAPPVEDDERDCRDGLQPVPFGAASTIAANDSTSSDAPPTRAPSTSGWPSSSAAFSGLTDPP